MANFDTNFGASLPDDISPAPIVDQEPQHPEQMESSTSTSGFLDRYSTGHSVRDRYKHLEDAGYYYDKNLGFGGELVHGIGGRISHSIGSIGSSLREMALAGNSDEERGKHFAEQRYGGRSLERGSAAWWGAKTGEGIGTMVEMIGDVGLGLLVSRVIPTAAGDMFRRTAVNAVRLGSIFMREMDDIVDESRDAGASNEAALASGLFVGSLVAGTEIFLGGDKLVTDLVMGNGIGKRAAMRAALGRIDDTMASGGRSAIIAKSFRQGAADGLGLMAGENFDELLQTLEKGMNNAFYSGAPDVGVEDLPKIVMDTFVDVVSETSATTLLMALTGGLIGGYGYSSVQSRVRTVGMNPTEAEAREAFRKTMQDGSVTGLDGDDRLAAIREVEEVTRAYVAGFMGEGADPTSLESLSKYMANAILKQAAEDTSLSALDVTQDLRSVRAAAETASPEVLTALQEATMQLNEDGDHDAYFDSVTKLLPALERITQRYASKLVINKAQAHRDRMRQRAEGRNAIIGSETDAATQEPAVQRVVKSVADRFEPKVVKANEYPVYQHEEGQTPEEGKIVRTLTEEEVGTFEPADSQAVGKARKVDTQQEAQAPKGSAFTLTPEEVAAIYKGDTQGHNPEWVTLRAAGSVSGVNIGGTLYRMKFDTTDGSIQATPMEFGPELKQAEPEQLNVEERAQQIADAEARVAELDAQISEVDTQLEQAPAEDADLRSQIEKSKSELEDRRDVLANDIGIKKAEQVEQEQREDDADMDSTERELSDRLASLRGEFDELQEGDDAEQRMSLSREIQDAKDQLEEHQTEIQRIKLAAEIAELDEQERRYQAALIDEQVLFARTREASAEQQEDVEVPAGEAAAAFEQKKKSQAKKAKADLIDSMIVEYPDSQQNIQRVRMKSMTPSELQAEEASRLQGVPETPNVSKSTITEDGSSTIGVREFNTPLTPEAPIRPGSVGEIIRSLQQKGEVATTALFADRRDINRRVASANAARSEVKEGDVGSISTRDRVKFTRSGNIRTVVTELDLLIRDRGIDRKDLKAIGLDKLYPRGKALVGIKKASGIAKVRDILTDALEKIENHSANLNRMLDEDNKPSAADAKAFDNLMGKVKGGKSALEVIGETIDGIPESSPTSVGSVIDLHLATEIDPDSVFFLEFMSEYFGEYDMVRGGKSADGVLDPAVMSNAVALYSVQYVQQSKRGGKLPTSKHLTAAIKAFMGAIDTYNGVANDTLISASRAKIIKNGMDEAKKQVTSINNYLNKISGVSIISVGETRNVMDALMDDEGINIEGLLAGNIDKDSRIPAFFLMCQCGIRDIEITEQLFSDITINKEYEGEGGIEKLTQLARDKSTARQSVGEITVTKPKNDDDSANPAGKKKSLTPAAAIAVMQVKKLGAERALSATGRNRITKVIKEKTGNPLGAKVLRHVFATNYVNAERLKNEQWTSALERYHQSEDGSAERQSALDEMERITKAAKDLTADEMRHHNSRDKHGNLNSHYFNDVEIDRDAESLFTFGSVEDFDPVLMDAIDDVIDVVNKNDSLNGMLERDGRNTTININASEDQVATICDIIRNSGSHKDGLSGRMNELADKLQFSFDYMKERHELVRARIEAAEEVAGKRLTQKERSLVRDKASVFGSPSRQQSYVPSGSADRYSQRYNTVISAMRRIQSMLERRRAPYNEQLEIKNSLNRSFPHSEINALSDASVPELTATAASAVRSIYGQYMSDAELSALNELVDMKNTGRQMELLRSSAGLGAKALYFDTMKVAVFFKDSTPDDILHEFTHHMLAHELIPRGMSDKLLEAFGTPSANPDSERKEWSVEAHENMVQAFLTYLSEEVTPSLSGDTEISGVFRYVADAFAYTLEQYENDGIEITDELRDVFDLMLGARNESEIARTTARAIKTHVDRSAQVGTNLHGPLTSGRWYQRISDDETILDQGEVGKQRNKLRRVIAAVAEEHGAKASEDVFGEDGILKRLAKELFASGEIESDSVTALRTKDLKGVLDRIQNVQDTFTESALADAGLEELGQLPNDDEVANILHDVSPQVSRKMREMFVKAEREAEKKEKRATAQAERRERIGLDETTSTMAAEVNADIYGDHQRANAIGGEGLYRSALRSVELMRQTVSRERNRLMAAYSSNPYTLAYMIAGGNKDSVVYQTLDEKFRGMQEGRERALIWMNDRLDEFVQKSGSVDFNPHKIVHIEGVRMDMSEVVGIYMRVTAGTDASASSTTDGAKLLRSSNAKYRMISDQKFDSIIEGVRVLIEEDPESGGYSAWEGRDKDGNFTYTAQTDLGKNIESVLPQATKEFKQVNTARNFVQYMRTFLIDVLDQIDPVFQDLNGRPVERADFGINYFPRVREDGSIDDSDVSVVSEIVQRQAKDGRAVIMDSVERSRSATSNGELNLDAFSIFHNYRKQALNYIGAAQGIHDLTFITRNAEFRSAVDAKFGGKDRRYDRSTMNVLLDMIEEERHPTGRTYKIEAFDRLAEAVRTNSTIGVLAFNISAHLRQPISLFNALSMVPVNSWGAAMKVFGRAQFAALGGLKDGSTLFHTDNPYENMREFKDIQRLDPVTAGRRFERDALDLMKVGVTSKVWRGRSVSDWMTSSLKTFDMMAVMSAWHGAYHSVMTELKNDTTISVEEKERLAVDRAREVVRQSQPPSNTQERTRLQKGSVLARMVSWLTGFVAVDWADVAIMWPNKVDKIWTDAIDAGHDPVLAIAQTIYSDAGRSGNEAERSAAKMFVLAQLIPAALLGITYRRRNPTLDELKDDIFMHMFISKMPIAGGALRAKMLYESLDMGQAPVFFGFLDAFPRLLAEVNLKMRRDDASMFDAMVEAGKSQHTIQSITQAAGIPAAATRLFYEYFDHARETGVFEEDLRRFIGMSVAESDGKVWSEELRDKLVAISVQGLD